MPDKTIEAVFTIIGLFITTGLTFAAIRQRQTETSYLLFWRNLLSVQTRSFLRHGFFQGSAAELSRILFFALFTLIAAAGLFGW